MANREGTNIGKLIEFAGRLPLFDDDPGSLYYEEFFEFVGATDAQSVRQYCQSLAGDQKCAVLLACIWAKAQEGKQQELNAQKAAEEALELLGDRPITTESLANLLRVNRRNVMSHDALAQEANLGTLDTYDFEVIAERLLSVLVH